jgi:hypothetical protein
MQPQRLLFGSTTFAHHEQSLPRRVQALVINDDWEAICQLLSGYHPGQRRLTAAIITDQLFSELQPSWRWAEEEFTPSHRLRERQSLRQRLLLAINDWLISEPLSVTGLPFLETQLDIYSSPDPGPLTYTLAERLLLALSLEHEEYPLTAVTLLAALDSADEAPALNWLRAHAAAQQWDKRQ